MKNKKKIIIAAIITIVLVASLIFIIALKVKHNNKKKDAGDNCTIQLDYLFNNEVSQRMCFIYDDKKLEDISLTIYFEDSEVAKAVYREYKANKEFKKYETRKNMVTLYYKNEDVKDYESYSKEEIIQEFTALGYIYKEKK